MAQLVKTVAGLAIASVKTVNGLAIASVKTVAGLDNTSGGPTPGNLVSEDFEGAGAPSGWTIGASADPDYTGVVLAGLQSLRCNPSASITGNAIKTFTANGTVYSRFMLQGVIASNVILASFRAGTSLRGTINITSGGVLRVVTSGGGADLSTDVMPVGTSTTIYVWLEYVKGTGSDAICRAGWSTTTTKPTLTAGGAKTCVSSNGTGTDDIDRIYCGSSSTSTMDVIYDNVNVATFDLGNG